MYPFLFFALIFAILGVIIHKSVVGPLCVFNGLWFCAVAILNIKLVSWLSPLSENTFMVLFIMLVTFNLTFFYLLLLNKLLFDNKLIQFSFKTKIKKSGVRKLFYIWMFLTLIEVLYSHGVPLLWMLLKIPKSYADYGIPTLHGFVNALSWVIVMSSFIILLENNTIYNESFFIIAMILIAYILFLARQSIVTVFVQVFCIYIYIKKISILKICLFLLTFIIFFGILGNIRSGSEHFKTVAGITTAMPNYLLGIYWVYTYFVTPICNMDFLINNYSFDNLMYGFAMMNSLLPSVIRNIIYGANSIKSIYHGFLVNPAFNVSTFLMIPYLDFGMWGVAMISSLYGVLGFHFWPVTTKITEASDESLMLYAVFFQIILMSFFVNMLFMLPFIVQFLLIKILFKSKFFVKKESRRDYIIKNLDVELDQIARINGFK